MTTHEPATPRRVSKPRWLDVRVIGGVLLLVVAVVVGAKVIGASSRTSPVWTARGDLAAGTVLTASDVVATEANLGDYADRYLSAESDVAGRMLSRPVHAGELLPVSALQAVGDERIVSLAVLPERMAPDVRHGSVIDVYLITGRQAVAGDEMQTELVQRGVTVQSVDGPASGGLSGAISSTYQVALMLSPDEAQRLVRLLPTGEPMVVLHSGRSGRQPDSG